MNYLCSCADALPLYAQWNNTLLGAATAMCGIVTLLALARAILSGLREGAAECETPGGERRSGAMVVYALLTLLILGIYSSGGLSQSAAAETTAFSPASFLVGVLLPLPIIICYAVFRPRPVQRMRLLPCCGLALAALGASLLFNTIYTLSGLFDLITGSTGSPSLQGAMQLMLGGDMSTRLLLIISAVVIAPIVEECCFRGFLYGTLKSQVGKVGAIILSSFFFGAIHMSLGHTLPLAVLAALLCLLYEKTRTLRACIIAHAAFNSLNILLLYLLPDT